MELKEVKETITKNLKFLNNSGKLNKGVLELKTSKEHTHYTHLQLCQLSKKETVILLYRYGSIKNLNDMVNIDNLILIKNELAQMILSCNAEFFANFTKIKKSTL